VIEAQSVNGTKLQFTVTGRVVLYDGYTAVWKESESDVNKDDQVLPPLVAGQVLELKDLGVLSRETQPPARFTEASLVKQLEELGVGRPSTYAGTVQILRDRAYVMDSRNAHVEKSGAAMVAQRAAGGADALSGNGSARGPLVPTLSAFCVSTLLEQHCPVLVDPMFTAQMEEQLDEIAHPSEDSGDHHNNKRNMRVRYLDEFYAGPEGLAAQIKKLEQTVPDEAARRIELPALQQHQREGEQVHDVGLFIGPWGPYVQELSPGSDIDKPVSASLPPLMLENITLITHESLDALLSARKEGGLVIGKHPDDGRNIRYKTGRYGAYLQWGDDGKTNTTTHSLPKDIAKSSLASTIYEGEVRVDDVGEDAATLDSSPFGGILSFEEAVGYTRLPRTVSTLRDLPIVAAIGPYGPYLKYNNTFASLVDDSVLTVDAETAERLVTEEIINGSGRRRRGRGVIAELGEKNGSSVTVRKGRFGNYINWKKVNVKLPVEHEAVPSNVPLEEAWGLIQEKAGKEPSKGKGKKKSSLKKSNPADATSKLPPPPKRPLSAYLLFCAERRPEVSVYTKSLGETSKALSTLWADISAEERERIDELAAAGKAEYEAQKLAWEKECEELLAGGKKKGTGKGRDARSGAAPKKDPRGPSAYNLFCKEHRPTVVDDDGNALPLGETTKRLAALWKECDNGRRKKFERQAALEKEMLRERASV